MLSVTIDLGVYSRIAVTSSLRDIPEAEYCSVQRLVLNKSYKNDDFKTFHDVLERFLFECISRNDDQVIRSIAAQLALTL